MGIFLEDTRFDSKKETIDELIESVNYNIYSLNETILNSEIAYNNILIKSINEEYISSSNNNSSKIEVNSNITFKEKIKNWINESKKVIKNLIDKIKEISINLFSKIASKFGLFKKFINKYKNEILNYNGEEIKLNINNWKNVDIISCKRIYEINFLKQLNTINKYISNPSAINKKNYGIDQKKKEKELILYEMNKAREDLLEEGTKEITISKNNSKLIKNAYDNILNYESDIKKLKILLDTSYKLYLDCDKDLSIILKKVDYLEKLSNTDENFKEDIKTLKDRFLSKKDNGTLGVKAFSIILGLTSKLLTDSFKIVKACVNNYNK